jgi:hypothetical protein
MMYKIGIFVISSGEFIGFWNNPDGSTKYFRENQKANSLAKNLSRTPGVIGIIDYIVLEE